MLRLKSTELHCPACFALRDEVPVIFKVSNWSPRRDLIYETLISLRRVQNISQQVGEGKIVFSNWREDTIFNRLIIGNSDLNQHCS